MEKSVILCSVDGEEIRYQGEELKNLALVSVTINQIVRGKRSGRVIDNIEYGTTDAAGDIVVKIPVGIKTLKKAIKYCEKHWEIIDSESKNLEDVACGRYNYEGEPFNKSLEDWDRSYIDGIDFSMLIDLVRASRYLRVWSLQDLTCEAMLDLISTKTKEEIFTMFRLQVNSTEDMQEAHEENSSLGYQNDLFNDCRKRPKCIKTEFLARRHDSLQTLIQWLVTCTDKSYASWDSDTIGRYFYQYHVNIRVDELESYQDIRILSEMCNFLYFDDTTENSTMKDIDIEVEVREREMDAVKLANAVKENVDQSIKRMLETGYQNNRDLTHHYLLLLMDDVCAEADFGLHRLRAYREQIIQEIQEKQKLQNLKISEEKMEPDSDKVDHTIPMEEDLIDCEQVCDKFLEEVHVFGGWHFVLPITKCGKYADVDDTLLSEHMLKFDLGFQQLPDGCYVANNFMLYRRYFLFQEVVMKDHQFLPTALGYKLTLHEKRTALLGAIKPLVESCLSSFAKSKLEAKVKNAEVHALNLMRENYEKEIMKIKGKQWDVDKNIDEKWSNAAIRFLQYLNKEHSMMIKEIFRQVDLVRQLIDAYLRKYTQESESDSMSKVRRVNGAKTSGAETFSKRMKIGDESSILTRTGSMQFLMEVEPSQY